MAVAPSSMVHSKVRYSLNEAAQLLAISRAMLYRRIAENKIDSHMDGRRRFVSARAIDVYCARCEAKASSRMPA